MCEGSHPGLKPQVLLLATQRWANGARLGLALRAAGFRVSIWSPAGHPFLLTDAFDRHFAYGALEPLATLEAALLAGGPDLIVPCDDLATHYLQRLAARAQHVAYLHHILAVIERSLGPATGLERLTARAHVVNVASAAGIPVPTTTRLHSAAELREWFSIHGFPAYLKADGSSGGMGVRPVHTYAEAQMAFATLDAPPRTLRTLKRLAIDRDTTLLGPMVRRQRPILSVQRGVAGVDANSAIFCWQGRVLASITVKVLATSYERGPSTVVQRIHNPAMEHAAHVLAAELQLSGFYGLDFVLDEQSGTPWLLEMNSRATQIAHLAMGPGHDLAIAAFAAVTGVARQVRPLLTEMEIIALFPQEWQRDPASPLLATAYHDVPWEAPALVRSFVNQRPGWRNWFSQQHWRERRLRQPLQDLRMPATRATEPRLP